MDGIGRAIEEGRVSFSFLEATPFRRWAQRSDRIYREVCMEAGIPFDFLRSVPSLPSQRLLAAAKNARSAVVKRGCTRPRPRIFSLMAQHGDLQVSVVDAKADEHAEQAAQEPIEHG